MKLRRILTDARYERGGQLLEGVVAMLTKMVGTVDGSGHRHVAVAVAVKVHDHDYLDEFGPHPVQ